MKFLFKLKKVFLQGSRHGQQMMEYSILVAAAVVVVFVAVSSNGWFTNRIQTSLDSSVNAMYCMPKTVCYEPGGCPPVKGDGCCQDGEDQFSVDCAGECGNGTCDSGEDCQSCPSDCSCPVDGQWCLPPPWGPCSVACGPGHQRANLVCNCPAPSNGGQPCQGPSTVDQQCVGNTCPGVWSQTASQQVACPSGPLPISTCTVGGSGDPNNPAGAGCPLVSDVCTVIYYDGYFPNGPQCATRYYSCN